MINADFTNSSEVTTDRLFQYDIGQKISISNCGSVTTPKIHFCNKISDKALAVNSTVSGSGYVVNIPNSLLAQPYDITAYLYVGDNDEAKTIKIIHIPLTKRLKPETYVPTKDDDVIDFLAITSEMRDMLNGLVITEYSNTASYKKPNIVCYQGQSYICKSVETISGILPTNNDKWGLMSKNGVNISTIVFRDNAFKFTLEDGSTINVNLSVKQAQKVPLSDFPGLQLTKTLDGYLKLGENLISLKKPIVTSTLSWKASSPTPYLVVLIPECGSGRIYQVRGKIQDFDDGLPIYIPFIHTFVANDKVGSIITIKTQYGDYVINFSPTSVETQKVPLSNFQTNATLYINIIYEIIEW